MKQRIGERLLAMVLCLCMLMNMIGADVAVAVAETVSLAMATPDEPQRQPDSDGERGDIAPDEPQAPAQPEPEVPAETRAPAQPEPAMTAEPDAPEASAEPTPGQTEVSSGETEAHEPSDTPGPVEQEIFGDINGDGAVNLDDLLCLMKDGVSLREARERMPLSILANQLVEDDAFEAELWSDESGARVQKLNHSALMSRAGRWDGLRTGKLCDKQLRYNAEDYPKLEGYAFARVTYDEDVVTELSMLAITDINGSVQKAIYLATVDKYGVVGFAVLPENGKLVLRYVASAQEEADAQQPGESDGEQPDENDAAQPVPPMLPGDSADLPAIPVPGWAPSEATPGEATPGEAMPDEAEGFDGDDLDAWIQEQLRALEEQYNSGIMPLSFVVGYIPWEDYFTVSGLPAAIFDDEDDQDEKQDDQAEKDESKTVAQMWLEDCQKVSSRGYNVDNTGVKYSKFPDYLEKGVHFASVTVNGVEVVRAGILMPDNDPNGKPVYYYMTQKHVDSDSNDGSGSHTGSVSALVLPENAKFQVNYAVNEYKLSYEIQLDGEVVTDRYVDPKAENPVTWEWTVFRGQNPAGTTNGEASLPVTIPYGYTARVYQQLEENDVFGPEMELTGKRKDSHMVNEGYPLGTEPEYEKVGNIVQPKSDSPSAKRMSAVFYSDLVRQNRHIIVKLTRETKTPVFDASAWVDTTYAANRGSAGEDKGWGGSTDKGGNIQTGDGWNWTSDKTAVTNLKMTDNKDGTYSIIWTFQTNGGGFILDSLALNDVKLEIPFIPATTSEDQKADENKEKVIHKKGAYTLTTLPDGATAELRYVRSFKDGIQQVYTLIITGARSNVTVTGGNLNMLGGAPEFIPTALTGVTADASNSASIGVYLGQTWDKVAYMSEPVVNEKDALTYDGRGFNVRFRMIDGYETPTFSWTNPKNGNVELAGSSQVEAGKAKIVPMSDLNGGTPDKNTIYEDTDGYYYIRLDPIPNDNYKILSLTITATAMKYMVRYMVGSDNVAGDDLTNGPKDENVENMPSFDTSNDTWDDDLQDKDKGGVAGSHLDRYDDNNGNFYDRQTAPTIPISDKVPTTKDETKFFQHWVLVDIDENVLTRGDGTPIIVRPNETIDLGEFARYAVDLNKDIGGVANNYYVLRLKGVWSELPTDFKFYIRMVWTDAQTGKSHVMDLVQNVTTSSTDANLIDDDRLVVTVNTVTDTFKNWFRLHPFYAYAARNFIPTQERSGDSFADKDGNIWEKYPEDFTQGSTEHSIPDPTAYYRVVRKDDIVKYEVQRNGTIILYLNPENGRLPISKTVVGSDSDTDEFTYTITAKLLPSDIERSTLEAGQDPNYLSPESLMHMLPSGSFFGMAPDAGVPMKGFTGVDAELHFYRNVFARNPQEPTVEEMAGWSSTATFTLKGGEATVLSVPQGNYTIVEASGDESFAYTVKVDGVKKADRTAEREVVAGGIAGTVSFENTVRPVDYELPLSKQIVGLNGGSVPAEARSADFSFTLALADGDASQVVMPNPLTASIQTSGGAGTGSFKKITFKHSGTYIFLITETGYNKEAYFPSPRSHSATVIVENQNGQLAVTKVIVDSKVYAGQDVANAKVAFTNTYIGDVGEAIVLPEVTKVLKGRGTLPAGMFTFELSAVEQPGMTLPAKRTATNGNGADGSVVFDPIVFTAQGEYTVTVREQSGRLTGIDYDGRTVTITYKVEPGDDGKLKVTQTTYSGGAGSNADVFENQAYADAGFEVEKEYDVRLRDGVRWDGDTFTVTASLVEAAGDVKRGGSPFNLGDTATLTLTETSKRQSFNFRFYNEGRYVFEVKEVNGGLPGVTYDSSTYYVTVTVAANGEELITAVSATKNGVQYKKDTIVFSNSFDNRIDVAVQAKKILNGADLKDGQFDFKLSKVEGVGTASSTAQSSSSNDANGNVTFTIRDLGKGTYRFIMSEVDGGIPGFTYDGKQYTVEIEVKEVKGAHVATVKYYDTEGNLLPEGEVPTFTNTYTSFGTLTVSNMVTGNGADPLKEFKFTFAFADENGDPLEESFDYELQFADNTGDEGAGDENGDQTSGLIMPLFAPGSVALTGKITSGANIQLRHGQSVTISGLPKGTSYTVVESEYDGYKVTYNDGTGVDVLGYTAEGVIEGDEKVDYKNELETGSLTVKKRVVNGEAEDYAKGFTFTVTLDDSTIAGTYGDAAFTGGVATLTLKHDESATISGLPDGVKYTVAEAEAKVTIDGIAYPYLVSYQFDGAESVDGATTEERASAAGASATVTFTNRRPKPNFTVVKTFDVECPTGNATHSAHTTDSNGKIAHVGDTVKYTVTVENTGDVKLTGLSLEDAFKVNGANKALTLALDVAASSGVGQGDTASSFSIEESGRAVFKAEYGPVLATDATLTNSATVKLGTKTVTSGVTTSVHQPNLSLAKTSNVTAAAPGTQIEYTLSVTDKEGAGRTDGFTVTDTLPAHVEYVSFAKGNEADGSTVTCENGKVTWTYTGSIAAEESKSVTITVQVKNGPLQETNSQNQTVYVERFTNAAVITSGDADSGTENSAEAMTLVADFMISKSATLPEDENNTAKEKVSLGDEVTYAITVQNIGGADLTELVIRDPMFARAEAGTLTVGGQPGAFDTVTDGSSSERVVKLALAKGASPVTITYQVKVTQEDIKAGKLENTATAKGEYVANTKTQAKKSFEHSSEKVTIATDGETPAWSAQKAVGKRSGANVGEAVNVRIGDVLVYSVTVKNTGNVTLESLSVIDALKSVPASGAAETRALDANSASGKSDRAPTDDSETEHNHATFDTANWTIQNLAPGETMTITYTYTVVAGDMGNTLANEVTVSVGETGVSDDTETPVENWAVSKAVGTYVGGAWQELTGNVDPQTELAYRITVRNLSDHVLNNLVLTDAFKGSNLSVDELKKLTKVNGASSPGATYVVNEQSGTVEIGNLPASSGVIVLEYRYTVKDSEAGTTITNTATVSGVNSNVVSTTINAAAATLRLSKAVTAPVGEKSAAVDVNNGLVPVGTTLTYTITLYNEGNVTLKNVALADVFAAPSKGTLSNLVIEGGSFADADKKIVEKIDPKKSVVITYTYAVTEADAKATRTDDCKITNEVSVTSYTYDGAKENGTVGAAKVSTTVESPRWQVSKEVTGMTGTQTKDAQAARVRDTLTYKITVKNTGNVDLNGLTLSDTLASAKNIDLTKATVAGGVLVKSGDVWTLNGVEAGGEATISYTYPVSNADLGGIENTVEVTGTEYDPADPSDNAASTRTEVEAWTVAKALTNPQQADAIRAGSTVWYTITVRNTGSVDLTGMSLSDVLTVTDLSGNQTMPATLTWAESDFEEGESASSFGVKKGTERTFRVAYQVGATDVFLSNVATVSKAKQGANATGTDSVSSGAVENVVYIDVAVTKQWKDGSGATLDDAFTGEITVNLYRDNNALENRTLPLEAGENKWSHTFTNLPAYDQTNKKPYTYTVKEKSGATEAAAGGTITLQNGYSYTVGEDSYTDTDPTSSYAYTIVNTLQNQTASGPEKSNDVTGGKVQNGDTITYTIKRTSHLSKYATATVTDTLPEGLTFGAVVSVKVNGAVWTKTENAQPQGNVYTQTVTPASGNAKTTNVEWKVYNVPPMAKVEISYTAIVNADAIALADHKLINNAKVSFGGDDALANQTVSNALDVLIPDLSITKEAIKNNAGIDIVKPGDAFSYKLTVQNGGKGKAKPVIVQDALPVEVELDPAGLTNAVETDDKITWTDGGSVVYDKQTRMITWTIDEIVAKGSGSDASTLSIPVKVNGDSAATVPKPVFDKDGKPAARITNTAMIDSGDDPNKTAKVSGMKMLAVADYTVSKSVALPIDEQSGIEKKVVSLGDVITYTIEVVNIGGASLTGITVADDMFADAVKDSLTVTTDAGEGGNKAFTQSGDKKTITLTGALAAGETVTITYRYQVVESDIHNETGDKGIVNTATVNASDPMATDSRIVRSASRTVETEKPGAQWEVGKTVVKRSGANAGEAVNVRVGDVLEYSVTVKNTGNVTLQILSVIDSLKSKAASGEAAGRTPDANSVSGRSSLAPAGDSETEHSHATFDAEDWTIENLAPGETMTITYAYTVVEGDMGRTLENEAAVYYAEAARKAQTQTPVENWSVIKTVGTVSGGVWKELSAERLSGEEGVPEGTELVYHITVKNESDHELINIPVSDTLTVNAQRPASITDKLRMLTGGSYTTAGAAYDSASGMITKLPKDGQITLQYTYQQTVAGDEIENAVVVGTNGPSSSVKTLVDKYEVDKSVPGPVANGANQPSIAVPGSTLTYTITVKNSGETKLNGLKVSDELTLSNGTRETIEWDKVQNLRVTPSTVSFNKADGTLSGVDAGVTVSISYEYMVPKFVEENEDGQSVKTLVKTLRNSVTVRDGSCYLSKQAWINVGQWHVEKALVLVNGKAAAGESVKAGDVLTYEITVTNDGVVTLSGLAVSDKLNGETFTFSDLQKSGGNATLSGNVINDLRAGESVKLRYTYQVKADDTFLSNTATVSKGGHAESDTEETVVSIDVTVLKKWRDGSSPAKTLRSELTGDITVVLYRSVMSESGSAAAAQQIGSVKMTAAEGTWRAAFSDLPATDASGKPYTYTVKESNGKAVAESGGTLTIGEHTFAVAISEDKAVNSASFEYEITNTLQSGAPQNPSKVAVEDDRAQGVNDGVAIDDTITYTIERVSHLNTTRTATITDTLPKGLTFDADSVTVTVSGVSKPAYTQTPAEDTDGQTDIRWVVEDVPPMAKVTISYRARVNADAISIADHKLANTAKVSFGSGDALAGKTASSTVDVRVPKLSIAKTADLKAVKPGKPLAYTLNVQNGGEGKAVGVVVTDTLPAEVELDEASLTGARKSDGKITWTVDGRQVVYTEATREIVWTIGEVGARASESDSATLTIPVKVKQDDDGYLKKPKTGSQDDEPAVYCQTIGNTAQIASGMPVDEDGNKLDHEGNAVDPANDPYTDTVNTPIADVFIDKNAADDVGDPEFGQTVNRYHPGNKITYTIRVKNVGGVRLTDVVVTDIMLGAAFEGKITLQRTDGSEETLTLNADGVSVTIPGGLEPEEDVTIVYVYEVTQSDIDKGSQIENTASVTAKYQPDPNEQETEETNWHSDDHRMPADPLPQWEIRKVSNVAQGEKAGLGQTIEYAITVRNTGNVSFPNVIVTDDVLEGLTITKATSNVPLDADDAIAIDNDEKTVRIRRLRFNETVTILAEYVVTEEDLLAGSVVNRVSVTGDPVANPDYDPEGPDDPDSNPKKKVPSGSARCEDSTEPENGHLTVVKTETSAPKNDRAYRPGETITYAITVTNDGNLTLTNITVADEMTGDRWTIASLAPGESRSFTASHKVTQADARAGTVVNVATAKGTSASQNAPEVSGASGKVISKTEKASGTRGSIEPVVSAPKGVGSVIRNASECYD